MRQQGVPATGTATKQQTFIHVCWAWLILPFVLEILATAFLAGVMFRTAQCDMPALKASALALFFHGPAASDGLVDALPRYTTDEMEASASKLSVRLTKVDGEFFQFESVGVDSDEDAVVNLRAEMTRWQKVRHVLADVPEMIFT